MIDRKTAGRALDAFAWTNGEAYLEAYEKVYGYAQRWDGYTADQFALMQNDGLRFIKKWPELAAQIVIQYELRD